MERACGNWEAAKSAAPKFADTPVRVIAMYAIKTGGQRLGKTVRSVVRLVPRRDALSNKESSRSFTQEDGANTHTHIHK